MRDNRKQAPRPQDEEDSTDAPSIVVVKTNGRNLSSMLLPPAFIVILALGILSYQKQTPIRSLASVPTSLPKPKSTETKESAVAVPPAQAPIIARLETRAVKVPVPLPLPDAAIATSLTRPENTATKSHTEELPNDSRVVASSLKADQPTTSPPADSPAEEKPPAERPRRSDLVKEASSSVPSLDPLDHAEKDTAKPESEQPDTEPPPQPKAEPHKITKEEVEADIRREAAQKAAELRKFQQAKPPRRIDQIEASRRVAQQNRGPFHSDLRKILKLAGKAAGPQIESLCDQYGRTALPEIRDAVGTTLLRTHGRLGRQSKIEMMRRLGLPEPNILEFLANDVHSTMHTPSGPRDPDEVWVFAARILLAFPVNPPRTAASRSKNVSEASKPAHRAVAPSGPQPQRRAK